MEYGVKLMKGAEYVQGAGEAPERKSHISVRSRSELKGRVRSSANRS
jgi:hypothetical protein